MSKKTRPKSGAGKIAGVAGYCLFLFAALAVGSIAGWINRSPIIAHIVLNAFNPSPPEKTFHANAVTLLILGCDEDLAPGGKKVLKKQARSDMMLIVKLDFKNNLVTG